MIADTCVSGSKIVKRLIILTSAFLLGGHLPFALARGNPALVAGGRAPSPGIWDGDGTGGDAAGSEEEAQALAARWARAFAVAPGAGAQVARATVKVGQGRQ